MSFALSSSYQKLDRRRFHDGMVTVWISKEIEDPCWDEFLKLTSLGQFQQSTIWARAKHSEGWKPVRVMFTSEDVVGGFQLLERSSWWGKIGYVTKGPVIVPERSLLMRYASETLRKVAEIEGLRALVAQAPDLCQPMQDSLAADGFKPDVLTSVNGATWVTELSGDFEAIEQRMRKSTRKQIREAKKRGVTIREGGREEISTFFQLMLSTCRRQGVKPNPVDEGTMLALWDAASPTRGIRLTLAECSGQTLAGLVCILFGSTASFWKKGWTSLHGQLHPNELLTHEMLRWVHSHGYHVADFTALDVEIALRMFKGQHLSAEQERSRHMFNIKFGGSALLLPEARVYFPNPLIRWAYSRVFRKKIARAGARCESVAQARRCRETLHPGKGGAACS